LEGKTPGSEIRRHGLEVYFCHLHGRRLNFPESNSFSFKIGIKIRAVLMFLFPFIHLLV
jgi:hypothetical protein